MEEKKRKVVEIIKKLKAMYPNPKIALNYSSPWELLVAVMLSAQTTDIMVNKITQDLFPKYKTLDDYINADPEEFAQYIRRSNFFKTKAKNIMTTAGIIKEKFNGSVPDTMEGLTSLPGVARKTANVLLGTIYHKYVGIVVDTHVRRLTNLLGLTSQQDPVKIEKDLMEIVPKEDWGTISYLLINYGRQYCSARPHDHNACPLHEYYI